MSLIKLPNGDDHPEAAGKHLSDASVLLDADRIDGAIYLSGYVVECSLKSLIIVGSGSPRGHDLTGLSRDALKFAALPNARTARYVPAITPGHRLYDRTNGWKVSLRYRAPGTVASQSEAAEWVAEARRVFKSTIVPMQLDGLV